MWVMIFVGMLLAVSFVSGLCTNDYTYNITQEKCVNATAEDPVDPVGDNTFIFFAFILLVIFFFLIYLTVNALGHLITMDFDVMDLSFNWGILFVIYGYRYFIGSYLGDIFMNKMVDTILTFAVFTNGLVPIIAFALSLTVGALVRKKVHDARIERGELPHG